MRSVIAASAAAALLAACVAGPPAASVGESAAAPAAEAAAVAGRFQQELAAKLQAAMAAGGPVDAVSVCHEAAPAIAARLSRDSGWNVRRVGTRVRNQDSGRPDGWEQAQLDGFARRHAAGEPLDQLSSYAEVREAGVASQRYMKAIVAGPQCLACHGDPASQPPELRSRLRQLYPQDAATGYRAGELRGAFTLRRPSPQ